MKKARKIDSRLPAGFSLQKVEAIRKHYDAQSDEAAAREDDAMAAAGEGAEMVVVPSELVAVVREMVSVFRAKGRKTKKIA